MPTKAGVGYGDYTETKLAQLGAILGMHLKITDAVLRKNPYYGNRYLYIDATAGPGLYKVKGGKTVKGSPLLFLEAAELVHPDYSAFFLEEVHQNAEALKRNISTFPQKKVDVREGRYQDLIKSLFNQKEKKQLGLIYVDPSTGIPDFGTLAYLADVLPRLEILMYLSATNIKRDITVPNLADLISSMKKKHWVIRRPRRGDQHQWTFLLGSNSNLFSDYKSIDFYRLNSDEANKFFPKLNMSKQQLFNALQKNFFDLLKK